MNDVIESLRTNLAKRGYGLLHLEENLSKLMLMEAVM